MGTLWQVLNDYATNLKSVQHVARMWNAGPGDYSVMQPRLAAALTEIATQRDILRPAIASSLMSEVQRTTLDGLVFDAYAETASIVSNPNGEESFGLMKVLGVTAPQVETSVALAERLGKSLLRLVYFLAGATITVIAYVKVSPLLFDPAGTHAAAQTWNDVQSECSAMRARCVSGDVECLTAADVFCGQLRKMALSDLPGSDSCGVLDTPYGTLVGLVLGIGFGWAGMRKVMGL
jgi:hypothetical protein